MHYTGKIIRPPFEARSKFLQVTSGCTHNKCRYCTYYEDVDFKVSSKDEILEDLEELKNEGYSFRRIWLLSADAFSLSTQNLLDIASKIHEYLPFVESIGAYARVDSIADKSIDDLNRLNEAGFNGIVFGIESADNEVLKYMYKGYSREEIIEHIGKVDKSSLKYTLIFLNALGGKDFKEHARRTAETFNKFHPERIMINGLEIHQDSHLARLINEERFKTLDDEEKITELINFIEELSIDTFLDATNNTNKVKFFGRIQENKEDILSYLRNNIHEIKK